VYDLSCQSTVFSVVVRWEQSKRWFDPSGEIGRGLKAAAQETGVTHSLAACSPPITIAAESLADAVGPGEAPDSGRPVPVVAIAGPHGYREEVPSKIMVAGVVARLGIEAAAAQRRGTLFPADTVVRCRAGYLFTTWWIPGVSVKAVRLGW